MRGCKDDLLSMLQSLICMLEKDELWLERDARFNRPNLERCSPLIPIFEILEKINSNELPPYNEIRFLFEKIILDDEKVPGLHNF